MIKYTRPPLWKRIVAFLYDLVLLNLILFPFNWYFEIYANSEILGNEVLFAENLLFILIGILFYALMVILYFSMFEYLLSKTPGQSLMRLKVEGQKKYWRYLVRSLFFILPFPLWVIDILFVFNKKRERLLEKLSKTFVIYN